MSHSLLCVYLFPHSMIHHSFNFKFSTTRATDGLVPLKQIYIYFCISNNLLVIDLF